MPIEKPSYPLQWPSDWPRTRIQDRKKKAAWKKTANHYRVELLKELERVGALTVVISTNIPLNQREQFQSAEEPRDTGVAIYFTRKRNVDFSWQDTLGVIDPNATKEMVEDAYRLKAVKHHPDKGGDKETWLKIVRAKEAALEWVSGGGRETQPVSIACDKYEQVRWNLKSLVLALAAFRHLETYGTSGLLDRAFKGFVELPQNVGGESA